MWPSGKAPGFGPGIRGFESLHPSHEKSRAFARLFSCQAVVIRTPGFAKQNVAGFGAAPRSSGKACFCQNKQAEERRFLKRNRSDIPPLFAKWATTLV